MKAVNLHLLTRIRDCRAMSLLYQSLSGKDSLKLISSHEAASLCALADHISAEDGDDLPLSLLDGFFFSYIIEHIGKEFDLLKISSDGECVLNIELKSEDIGEEKIKKQLEQNRYYLSHVSRTIFSFTYVMDTDTLYHMNDRGYLREAGFHELIDVLRRPALSDCLQEEIDRLFRASDYLISPVASPEKFLQGQYFLTNQQFDFRRRILECLREQGCGEAGSQVCGSEQGAGASLACGSEQGAGASRGRGFGTNAVISVEGAAGTGKTLLLFDLAMQLSRKSRVLLLHSGSLRKGHILIDERLKNVDIRSGSAACSDSFLQLSGYDYLLIDEADHLGSSVLGSLLTQASAAHIPVILAYDSHQLLENQWEHGPEQHTAELITRSASLALAFTGNIRINRPVYSFLRTLLNLKEHPGNPDYSCITVLFAENEKELSRIADYYREQGYEQISDEVPGSSSAVIAQEYGRVLMVLDDNFYYDESLHLCVRDPSGEPLRLLYEGLSRTREKLCLIVTKDRELFLKVLGVRLGLEDVP